MPEQLVSPWIILAAGILTVVGLIVVLRANAFLALITAALLVSVLAPGPLVQKSVRVATAFGEAAGRIGIVIALAAVIGRCMMDSGAADRVVRGFLSLLGEKRGGTALVASGYVLSIPVFFDTVFYLLLPLARSASRRTGGRHYLKYLLAIAAGATATHTMVPPTPGPLAAAANLQVDLGLMMMIGILVAVPSSAMGLFVGSRIDRRLGTGLRPLPGGHVEPEPLPDERLPPLSLSLLPIVLPVLLISTATVLSMLLARGVPVGRDLVDAFGLAGDPNLALLVSAILAILLLYRQRRPSREQMAATIEDALTSGGVIILITAAGGAFGAMLRAANVGPAIESIFRSSGGAGAGGGVSLLLLGALMSVLFKVAQGSSTVAILTASAMMAAMLPTDGSLPFHPVYVALAVSAASLIGTWMNDSAFWLFAKMGGFSETETLRSWTVVSATVGLTGLVVTVLLALLLPLKPALP